MTIDRITYKQKLPTGLFLNEDIGFECSVNVTDNPLEVIKYLRELSYEAHKAQYPHLYTSNGKPVIIEQIPEQTIQRETKETATSRMIQAIQDCTDLKVLETFKLLAEKNPDFKEVYDKKFQSLQNQTT